MSKTSLKSRFPGGPAEGHLPRAGAAAIRTPGPWVAQVPGDRGGGCGWGDGGAPEQVQGSALPARAGRAASPHPTRPGLSALTPG